MKKAQIAILSLLLALLLLVGCDTGDVLDNKIVLGEALPDNPALYIVTEERYGELDLMHVAYNDGIVLMTVRNYITGEVSIVSYNVNTGEKSEKLTSTVASAFLYKSGFTESGEIFVFDGTSNALALYDDGLKLIKKSNFINVTVGEIYVGERYAFCTSGSSIVRIDLTNNATETLASFDNFNSSSLSFVGAFEDELIITGYGDDLVPHLIVCDMRSGECEDIGTYKGKMMLSDGLLVNDTFAGESLTVYDFRRPGVRTELCLEEEDERLLGVGPYSVCTMTVEGDGNNYTQTLRAYSIEQGRLAGATEYSYNVSEFESNIREVHFIDSSYAVFELIDDGRSSIAIWDISASTVENDGGGISLMGGAENKAKKECDELISEIYEKYGIEVLSGDDSVRFYPDYVVLPEYDAGVLCDTLQIVKKTLEKYPDGFFAELAEKSYYDSLKLVVADALIPSHLGSLTSASGYYTGMGDIQYLLLSARAADIENTLSHELFHAIEDVMGAYSHDEFGKWNSYNPEGFAYKNSYVDESGKEYSYEDLSKYTPYDIDSLTNPDNIYFFDHYSQTYAKEDRARIFEMLLRDTLPEEFESVNLKNKAKYLCERLDLFFDSVENGNSSWERILK